MSEVTMENVLKALDNMSVMQMIALTKELESLWGVKAEPKFVQPQTQQVEDTKPTQSEFNVTLASVPADKKMTVIKAIREVLGFGLKESKELAESAPKLIAEACSKEDADRLKSKLEEAGAVIEVK